MTVSVLPWPLTRRASLGLGFAFLATACRPGAGSSSSSTSSSAPVGQQLADSDARRFYATRGWKPAWDKAKTSQLGQILAGAPAHGLAAGAFAPKPVDGVENDEALTLAALHYAKTLASGLIDPKKIEPVFTLQRNSVDAVAGLQQALDRDGLAAWYNSLPPQDAEYKMLSAAYLTALSQAGVAAAPAQGAPVGTSGAPTDKARQLAANLERRRWLARTPAEHRIDVNLAGAFLNYFTPGQGPVFLRTIVGRDDHATPSLQAEFHRVVANPPWRVPAEIAAKEILPKGDGYLANQNMRVLEGGQVEQAPGPKNALGLVKFDVEDPYQIYLHDTPAKAAFAQHDRHRSHGCVRVENAVDFARRIAAETGKSDAFDTALASGDTRTVDLGQTIPVRLLYHTAYPGPPGIALLPDVYGTDDKLATALGLGQAAAAAARRPPSRDDDFGP